MSIFFVLLVKIIPLYILILIGYLTNKFLHVTKEGIARMLIYVFTPAVVFLGVVQAKGNSELFLIPVVFFVIATALCLVNYFINGKIWNDGTEKIAAFAAGTGNTGYFGLPVCLAILGDKALPIIIMVSLGLIIYENTIGFYVVAKASHTTKAAFYRLLTLPSLYAFIIAGLLDLMNFVPSADLLNFFTILKGGYVPLGMMLIGLGLAEIRISHFDWKFATTALLNKFIVWPAIFLTIIYFDKHQFHLFNSTIYSVFLIESLVPLAANCVSYATELKAHPQKVALVVAVSTLIGIIYIPAATALFL